jgi:hypothetical protein
VPQQINKTGIDFDTITYLRVKQPDQSFRYFEIVSYEVLTNEESFVRTRQRLLTGATATAVANRYAAAETTLKAIEGIP